MGLFNKTPKAAEPLAPVPAPIGVFRHFTQHPQQLALQVRERKVSISGDDFAVKDAVTKQTAFKVEGKAFSLSDKKEVKDANGTHLFTIRKKHIAIHSTYQGLDPTSEEQLFVVKSSFSLGTKLTATFNNKAGDGQEVTLHLKGDLVRGAARVAACVRTLLTLPCALCSLTAAQRSPQQRVCPSLGSLARFSMPASCCVSGMNPPDLFPWLTSPLPPVDQQTYVLTVAPGVDAALLLAICICLDEKANEKK